jgi:hypothetical protein
MKVRPKPDEGTRKNRRNSAAAESEARAQVRSQFARSEGANGAEGELLLPRDGLKKGREGEEVSAKLVDKQESK